MRQVSGNTGQRESEPQRHAIGDAIDSVRPRRGDADKPEQRKDGPRLIGHVALAKA